MTDHIRLVIRIESSILSPKLRVASPTLKRNPRISLSFGSFSPCACLAVPEVLAVIRYRAAMLTNFSLSPSVHTAKRSAALLKFYAYAKCLRLKGL